MHADASQHEMNDACVLVCMKFVGETETEMRLRCSSLTDLQKWFAVLEPFKQEKEEDTEKGEVVAEEEDKQRTEGTKGNNTPAKHRHRETSMIVQDNPAFAKGMSKTQYEGADFSKERLPFSNKNLEDQGKTKEPKSQAFRISHQVGEGASKLESVARPAKDIDSAQQYKSTSQLKAALKAFYQKHYLAKGVPEKDVLAYYMSSQSASLVSADHLHSARTTFPKRNMAG